MTMLAVLRQVWPRERFPKVRGQVAHLYGRSRQLKHWSDFQVWSTYSRIRYGDTRWLELFDSRRILVHTRDVRSFRVAETGGTQREKVGVWQRIARYRPDVCVDVGANYGEFTTAAGQLGVRVIAIEANPTLVPCLRETCAPYPGVTVVHVAASDTEGPTRIFFHPGASGSGSLAREVPAADRAGVGVATDAPVMARRLDALVPDALGRSPQSLLLKVDVEGHEPGVLAGAEALLRGLRWWRAIVEFNPAALTRAGHDPRTQWERLRRYRGAILDNAVDVHSVDIQLRNPLPDDPAGECDVLIGAGELPAPAA